MASRMLTRRSVTRATAAAPALLAMPFVRGAHAAGKLSVGFWDHWVPGANKATTDLVNEWAAKEKVEVTIDYITSQGNKLLLTTAAEAQAKAGHDIMAMSTWRPNEYAKVLEPVDDITAPLIQQNGAVNDTVAYLGRADGRWVAVPATVGGQIKGPCSRIDLMKQHAGIDIQAMYPAGGPPKAEAWTMDAFLKAAADCHKAGFPFAIGLGTTADSVDTWGSIFHAFGAELVNAKGDITVNSDKVRQALEYGKRLTAHLPPDAPSYDDATNNRSFVAGKTALIMNPPSAWAVARRDQPQIATQTWHHGMAAGPAGRYGPFTTQFWGLWNFSKNQSAAKSLLTALSQAPAIEEMVKASAGYDNPPFANLTMLKVWAEEGPPKGTLFHYPNPYNHQILSIAAAPAPHKIAVQIYRHGIQTQMVQGRRITDQKSIDVTAMVLNGLINTRILAICRDLAIEAVGGSGGDAGVIRAHKRAPGRVSDGGDPIDYGYVGDVDSVDTHVLEKLLDNGLMPVVSPLSADSSGTLLNINADTVAAAIGGALAAEKLVLCTGATGILERVEDPGSVISYTDLKGLKNLRDQGSLKDGMLPKAAAIEAAIRGGVRRVHVISYKSHDSVLAEVFTNEGTGTLVVADLNALSPAEQITQ